MKILMPEMRTGVRFFTCSNERSSISRCTWWVSSFSRASTFFVIRVNTGLRFWDRKHNSGSASNANTQILSTLESGSESEEEKTKQQQKTLKTRINKCYPTDTNFATWGWKSEMKIKVVKEIITVLTHTDWSKPKTRKETKDAVKHWN